MEDRCGSLDTLRKRRACSQLLIRESLGTPSLRSPEMDLGRQNIAEDVLSPHILAEVITFFGARPYPTDTRIRFPLRGCRGTAHLLEPERDSIGIEILDLALSGIGFTANDYVREGAPIVIDFSCAWMRPQLWPCRVARVEQGKPHRIGAKFDRTVAVGEARMASSTESRRSALTPREIEVLRYVAGGLAKKEIAGIMHVSIKTVEKHTEHLMRKLDIHDRVELARFAIREGFTEP